MTAKSIWTPSSIGDYEQCKLKYKWGWEDNVVFPSPVAPQPDLGTLVHALQAAYDSGGDPDKSLQIAIKKLKTGPGYNVNQFATVKQMESEAKLIYMGGQVKDSKGKVSKFPSYPVYRKALEVRGSSLESIAVEKTIFVDLGPLIVAPTLDLVLQVKDSGDLWTAEHKLTERDDAAWDLRWTLDAQTTIQVLAAEAYYKQDVRGLLLLPIPYGRKKAPKDDKSKSILNRPIIRIERPEARWVSKSSLTLRAGIMGYLEDLAHDYALRLESNRWPPSGMSTRACDLCTFRQICAGKDSAQRLQPMLKNAHQMKLTKMRKTGKPHDA